MGWHKIDGKIKSISEDQAKMSIDIRKESGSMSGGTTFRHYNLLINNSELVKDYLAEAYAEKGHKAEQLTGKKVKIHILF
jgi:hypothetical protein